jgi:sugar phosphate isomerase/epimerase
MSIAVSGTEFTDADGVEGLIDMARSARCDAVEFWYPKNAVRDGVGAALGALDRAGLRVACVSTPSQLYGADEADAVPLLHEAITMAARTGCNRVNTYFGHAPVVDDEGAITAYAGALAPVLDHAAAEDVVVVLENEFDAFGWDPAGSDVSRRPEALAALFARVNSPLVRAELRRRELPLLGGLPRPRCLADAPAVGALRPRGGRASRAGGDPARRLDPVHRPRQGLRHGASRRRGTGLADDH